MQGHQSNTRARTRHSRLTSLPRHPPTPKKHADLLAPHVNPPTQGANTRRLVLHDVGQLAEGDAYSVEDSEYRK